MTDTYRLRPSPYHVVTTSQAPYSTFSPARQHVVPDAGFSEYHNGDVDGYNGARSSMSHPAVQQDNLYPSDATSQHLQTPQSSSETAQHALAYRGGTSASHPHSPEVPPPLSASSVDEAAGDFDMLPPPESTHSSWQALHDFAQAHASEHGYALSINTTAKNRQRIKLACVCYGHPKNTHKLTPETRVRKGRVSYKTDCKMWVEGRKQDDSTWLLRVGEARHNHPGRASEGWAVQRKRTWGVTGGRSGVGGVTAKEEQAQLKAADGKEAGEAYQEEPRGRSDSQQDQTSTHSLERGGLVWQIVEQEMLRKREPKQGRDRGVGRTVEVLQARLPGIHIFKRDVYNIRAQIKRARKLAGEQVGDNGNEEADEGDGDSDAEVDAEGGADDGAEKETPQDFEDHSSDSITPHVRFAEVATTIPEVAPSLSAPSTALSDAPGLPRQPVIIHSVETELERLRRENADLRRLLVEKNQEVKEKTIEITGLRTQLDYMSNMMLSR